MIDFAGSESEEERKYLAINVSRLSPGKIEQVACTDNGLSTGSAVQEHRLGQAGIYDIRWLEQARAGI